MQADLATYEGTSQLWLQPFRKYPTLLFSRSWEDMRYSLLFTSVMNYLKRISSFKGFDCSLV